MIHHMSYSQQELDSQSDQPLAFAAQEDQLQNTETSLVGSLADLPFATPGPITFFKQSKTGIEPPYNSAESHPPLVRSRGVGSSTSGSPRMLLYPGLRTPTRKEPFDHNTPPYSAKEDLTLDDIGAFPGPLEQEHYVSSPALFLAHATLGMGDFNDAEAYPPQFLSDVIPSPHIGRSHLSIGSDAHQPLDGFSKPALTPPPHAPAALHTPFQNPYAVPSGPSRGVAERSESGHALIDTSSIDFRWTPFRPGSVEKAPQPRSIIPVLIGTQDALHGMGRDHPLREYPDSAPGLQDQPSPLLASHHDYGGPSGEPNVHYNRPSLMQPFQHTLPVTPPQSRRWPWEDLPDEGPRTSSSNIVFAQDLLRVDTLGNTGLRSNEYLPLKGEKIELSEVGEHIVQPQEEHADIPPSTLAFAPAPGIYLSPLCNRQPLPRDSPITPNGPRKSDMDAVV